MKQAMFLLLNDIHVAKDNIPEFQDNWNEAIDLCTKFNISSIIVGGDMFQSRSSQTLSVLLAVKSALISANSRGINVIIAEGNHDRVDQESYNGYNQVFSQYPGVEVIEDYAIYELSDDAEVYVMSYFPENGSFMSLYNDMVDVELDSSKTSVLYLHEGIKGGLAVPSDDELPASIFQPFDAVLVGHYHNRKKIPGTNIEYIGASRQHNFGEDEEKGYTVLYSDGSYEFIKNQANTRYKIIEVSDVSGLNEEFFNTVQKLKARKYKIKVRISCGSADATLVDKQKLLDTGISKVEILTGLSQTGTLESSSIEQKFDKAGIKQEYSRFCAEHNIANVEIGLSYLDKIK